MATTTTDPRLGRLVDGRYEIVARVARGGMATVYRARDRRLGRDVAVKIMHAHLAEGVDGASFVSRFRREARASARLSHPGVVAVFDQGVDGDTSYLTMEYVPGHNLRAELREGPLRVGRALDVVAQVLAALGAAHRVGLVHRDVKPENVLVDDEDRVKVADFGLARAVTEVTSTATGTILGTVAYLAPEVITSGGCTPATDVYAVGVLLHEMLTGTLPYPGETPVQVAFRHVHEDLPPASDRVAWLPAEVDALIASFTARDPARRPAHAGAALTALRALRAGLDDDLLDRTADAAAHGATGATALSPAGGPADEALGDGAAASPSGAASADDVDEIPAAFFADVAATGHATEHVVTTPTTAMPDRRTAPGGEDAPARPPRRRRRTVVALLCVLVLLAGGGLGGWWWFADGPGAWTDVPTGLVGAEAESARTTLDDAGLAARTTEEFHDEVPEGEVIGSEPGAGEPVRRDGAVTLVVSLGVEMLTVPTGLVGTDQGAAEAELEDAGFTVGPSSGAYDDAAPEGEVLEVSVDGGTRQPHDTEVRLTVSQGPAPVQVPQVVGRAQADAEQDLSAAGLRADYADPEHSTEVAEGHVLAQDPEQGSDARRTDTVTLTLSAGPREVQVPDVVGMSEQEAAGALADAGFDVDVDRYLGGLLDTVRFQDATGKAPEGSTVTLTVW